jgi:hypothetical protein
MDDVIVGIVNFAQLHPQTERSARQHDALKGISEYSMHSLLASMEVILNNPASSSPEHSAAPATSRICSTHEPRIDLHYRS